MVIQSVEVRFSRPLNDHNVKVSILRTGSRAFAVHRLSDADPAAVAVAAWDL
jgi:hypothetical protein